MSSPISGGPGGERPGRGLELELIELQSAHLWFMRLEPSVHLAEVVG